MVRAAISVAILLSALSAIAAPATMNDSSSSGQCNTGTVQCCDAVAPAGQENISKLLGYLNIPVEDETTMVGLSCGGSGVSAGGGSECNAKPLCCDSSFIGGLIGIGCSPITVTA